MKKFLIGGGTVLFAWAVDWGTESLFGNNLFECVFELVFLGILAIPVALLIWVLLLSTRLVLQPVLTKNGTEQAKRVLRLRWAFVLAVAVLLIPHYMMSYKLKLLKLEFNQVAQNWPFEARSTGERHDDGRAVLRADFEGKLDNIVAKRSLVLYKYGYVPFGTGGWYFHDTFFPRTNTAMPYIYTYLPRTYYIKLFPRWIKLLGGPEVRPEEIREIEKAAKIFKI